MTTKQDDRCNLEDAKTFQLTLIFILVAILAPNKSSAAGVLLGSILFMELVKYAIRHNSQDDAEELQ